MRAAPPILVALLLGAPPAAAAEAHRQALFDAEPRAVWAAIGGVCGVARWRPGVTACAADGPRRTLTLADGARIVERELERDDRAMRVSYTIESGPLPITDDFRATMTVVDQGDRARVTWRAEFTPPGDQSEAMAEAVFGRMFTAGLEGLGRRLRE